MAYRIDNAIIKKDRNGKITLIDPENVFGDEDAFIAYLLSHGVTHKELNEGLEIPLRKIQNISKNIDRKEI